MEQEKKSIYKCNDIQLCKYGSTYIVEQTGKETQTFDNPLIAWNYFWGVVDFQTRKRIGDTLERQGRCRYTGKLKEGVQHRG